MQRSGRTIVPSKRDGSLLEDPEEARRHADPGCWAHGGRPMAGLRLGNELLMVWTVASSSAGGERIEGGGPSGLLIVKLDKIR